ncbi:MAG: hypothetical protein HY903_01750 [Deltaproteobacteria bacterium]|nr:hypothetical protein [Deltaproteobacteria bacterium]
MTKTAVIVITLGLLSVFGCKDQAAPTPGPAAAGSPTTVPAGHPATGIGDLPALPSGEISGALQIADNLKDKVAAGDTVFIMAKNAATGSLVAVTKIQIGDKFPLAFRLSGGDVMHAQTSLAGKVKIEARVDKDKDAMTKNPGDVYGETKELVAIPATGVELTLDRLL